jgi:tRNA-splicing ligase RtcB (3'-phosphate/5'-hydroxy nucleic acid ligase)
MMNGHEVLKLGYPRGVMIGLALKAAELAKKQQHLNKAEVLDELAKVLAAPESYVENEVFSNLAAALIKDAQERVEVSYDLDKEAPYQIWGASNIEPGAIEQLKRAVRLPVSVRGALMPDAHVGYGLPIGGVLATYNSAIPYAVGVDIACRMRLTVYDASPIVLEQKREKYRKILENNTVFGAGVHWEREPEHEVMDDPLWREHPVARQFKNVAWRQLGTSGSGNHFVEFGTLEATEAIETPQGIIPPGKYLALLSHSGSRRLGMEIADHYTEIAMQNRRTLPKDFVHLAWLDLDEEAGAEYWAGMELAGKYASANHAVIHRNISEALHLPIIGGVENHHNFAWKETHNGEEVVVHRKGATPAGEGVLGVIPGSMSATGYVVRGRGVNASLASAAHGAGRRMSRSEAFKRFDWDTVKRKLKSSGVDLISAGLDESPGAYKDIELVMEAQRDLVETLATFQPKVVKMDASNGRRNLHGERLD